MALARAPVVPSPSKQDMLHRTSQIELSDNCLALKLSFLAFHTPARAGATGTGKVGPNLEGLVIWQISRELPRN